MDQILSQGPLFLICLIFMMGIVIVIHEYGHYLAARYYGVAVESFSVGFGKPLVETLDRRGTRWRINWIPLGGFVSFLPENAAEVDVGRKIDGKSFDALKPWPKIVVSLAGPAANFLLAVFIFALSIGVNGVAKFTVEVADVVADMPAEAAGLQAGDRLIRVNGRDVNSRGDASMAILVSPNKPVVFTVDRQGQTLDIPVTPIEMVRPNEFGQVVPQSTAGIVMQHVELNERVRYGPIGAVVQGVIQTGRTVDQTVAMLGRIVTGNMSIHAMSGPVGVGDISRRAVNRVVGQDQLSAWEKTQMLFWMLLSVCAAVSVGVGFFNLLPLPVLDGGRVVFHAYEAVTGSKLPMQVEAFALRAGVFLLLLLVVVITWGDVVETGVFGRGGG